MRFQNLILAAALLALAAADRARADNLYYTTTKNGTTWTAGTLNPSTGATTAIGSGMTLNSSGEKLMVAPNGTLYGFDVADNGAWGSINPATGAYTPIGNLAAVFPGNGYGNFNESQGFSLAFGSSGALYATGWGSDGYSDFGTLNLATGAFTKISSPFGNYYEGTIAASGNNLYYTTTKNGTTWTAGTLNPSTGATTAIGSGMTLNSSGEKLMVAPNGTLYGFDVADNGAWGSINPATGAYTPIGNLAAVFPGNGYGNFNESQGFSLAFGSSGALYATGWGSDGYSDFGTLNLATGAFTKISSPFGNYYEGTIAAPVPEPSTILLLGIGAVSLLAYGWRRRTK